MTALPPNHFAVVFPLPLRILSLISLALLAWASNLHWLASASASASLPAAVLLGLPPESEDGLLPSPATHAPFPRPLHLPERLRRPLVHPTKPALGLSHTPKLHPPIYYAALFVGLLTLLGFIIFRFLTAGDPDAVVRYSSFPLIWACLVILLSLSPPVPILSVCLPFYSHFRLQRRRFRSALRRIATGGLTEPPALTDVLLADILTSFGRVIGDIWISICLAIVAKQGLATQSIEIGCYKHLMVPALTSLPYAFRLRQCLAEVYSRTSTNSRRSLLNALKYATAFPLIGLSVLVSDDLSDTHAHTPFQRRSVILAGPSPAYPFWLLAALINSLYSFWWDVTNDWSFDLLRPALWSSSNHLAPSRSPLPSHEQSLLPRRTFVRRSRHTYQPLTPEISLAPTPHHQESFRLAPAVSSPVQLHSPFAAKLLRSELLFRPISLYALFIALNLALRLTWTARLLGNPSETAAYLLEILEILRRWLWCFVRLEAEMVRQTAARAPGYTEDVGEDTEDEQEDGSTGSFEQQKQQQEEEEKLKLKRRSPRCSVLPGTIFV